MVDGRCYIVVVVLVVLAAALVLPLRLLASLVVEGAKLPWGLASGLVAAVALIVVLPAQVVTALAP